MLHVCVGREAEALLLAACSIELYQVAGDVLYARLGAFLYLVPRASSQLADTRRHALLAAVFRQLVQRVYAHIDSVVVLVHELDHLLGDISHGHTHQPGKPPDAVVDMDYVVAGLDAAQFLEAHGQLAAAGAVRAQLVAVETVEYLVVGEQAHAVERVYKPLVQRRFHRREGDVVAALGEYGAQTLVLVRIVAEYEERIPLGEQPGE